MKYVYVNPAVEPAVIAAAVISAVEPKHTGSGSVSVITD